MALLTPAQNVAMLRMTGGEVVVDTASGESSYGHFEELPVTVFESAEYGEVLESGPSVVIVKGAFTHIGVRTGVDRAITVGGDAYQIRRPLSAAKDGGLLRLMLAEV